MIDVQKLRNSEGYVLAIVNTKTGEYEIVKSDLMPVIRCKDCKHYDVGENDSECWTWCKQHEMNVDDDFFCKDGERKEE